MTRHSLVLKEHDVYEVIQGRIVDMQDRANPDVISVGLAQLSHGNLTNPITAFNEEFDRLRERRNLTPISEDLNFEIMDQMVESTAYAASSTPAKTPTNSTERFFSEETGDKENGNLNTPSNVADSEDGDAEPNPELDTLLMESPTLECVDEEDVALDMNGWELNPGSDSEDSESEEVLDFE